LNVADGALNWQETPVDTTLWWQPWAWIQRLAVGADGTLWVAASMYTADAGQAVLFAYRDDGDAPVALQDTWTQLDVTGQWALGLALDQSGGETTRVVVGTSAAPILGAYSTLGALSSVDPVTRAVEWEFYPVDASDEGGVTGVALDANGTVFATFSGTTDGGHVVGISRDGDLLWNAGIGGLAEWASPTIGPDGTLYVADTRQCALRGYPIEDGYCDGVNITPVVYAFEAAAGNQGDSGGDGGDTAGSGCGCDSGGGGGEDDSGGDNSGTGCGCDGADGASGSILAAGMAAFAAWRSRRAM
jgi:hypothetical protein